MQNTKKIGIIVKDLSPSYLSFCLIDMINKQVEETPDYDFTIFYENRYPNSLDVLCSTMSSSEIWNFDGVLISTDISTTLSSLNSSSVRRRLFYVWDLEWTRQEGKDYDYVSKAYNHKEVELVSRSVDHSPLLENYSNKKVSGVVDDFSFKDLKEILDGQQ